jgi:TolB protein
VNHETVARLCRFAGASRLVRRRPPARPDLRTRLSWLCIVLALALTPVFATMALSQQEVYLQVTSPGLKRVTIAVPDFVQRGGVDAGAAKLFATTLHQDLQETAVISLLADQIVQAIVPDLRDPAVTRSRYRSAGAQFLLEGSLAGAGNQLVTEVRLWDLASGEIAYSRRLEGASSLADTMAHTLANELLHLFTGRPGPFLSRIAFISDRSGNKELWLMRWDGSDQQQITRHHSIALSPAWSADGKWLAFTSFLHGSPELLLLRPTEGYLKPLSTVAGVNSSASFSPDGKQIAFAAGAAGYTNIWVVDVPDGTPQRLTGARAIETQPAWSPSGRQIAFTSNASGTPELYLMDAEGTNVRRLTFQDQFADEAAWAPDGIRIAYTTKIENHFQIATIDLRTLDRQVVTGPGNNESPCWSPDGTMLAFTSDRSGSQQIYVTDPNGAPRQLTSAGDNSEPAWVAHVQ